MRAKKFVVEVKNILQSSADHKAVIGDISNMTDSEVLQNLKTRIDHYVNIVQTEPAFAGSLVPKVARTDEEFDEQVEAGLNLATLHLPKDYTTDASATAAALGDRLDDRVEVNVFYRGNFVGELGHTSDSDFYCQHAATDLGYDCIDTQEEALESLIDVCKEHMQNNVRKLLDEGKVSVPRDFRLQARDNDRISVDYKSKGRYKEIGVVFNESHEFLHETSKTRGFGRNTQQALTFLCEVHSRVKNNELLSEAVYIKLPKGFSIKCTASRSGWQVFKGKKTIALIDEVIRLKGNHVFVLTNTLNVGLQGEYPCMQDAVDASVDFVNNN